VPLPHEEDGAPAHQIGASVFYAELLPRLARAGHSVRAVVEAPPAPPGAHRRAPSLDVPGLEVEPFAFGYRSGREPADPAWRRAAIDQVRPLLEAALGRRRPDLVLIGREILAPVLQPLCAERGLPCAVIAHGVTLAAAAGPEYPEEPRRSLYDGLRAADRVIAVAHHLAASLRSVGVERVASVPNAPDTERFRPRPPSAKLSRELDLPDGAVVVAQIASLRRSKRPGDLVAAARRLAGEAPRVVYLLVGDGPERAPLEQAVRDARIADAFRFVGAVEHERMPELVNAVDVVVLASGREGLPLVYGEARASGRVLLASDIPAARESIAPDETGVLYRCGDPADLAGQLRALVGDPERRARIGAAARAAALAWNADAAADAHARELARAAGRDGSAPGGAGA